MESANTHSAVDLGLGAAHFWMQLFHQSLELVFCLESRCNFQGQALIVEGNPILPEVQRQSDSPARLGGAQRFVVVSSMLPIYS